MSYINELEKRIKELESKLQAAEKEIAYLKPFHPKEKLLTDFYFKGKELKEKIEILQTKLHSSIQKEDLLTEDDMSDIAFKYFQDSVNPEHIKGVCQALTSAQEEKIERRKK